MRTVILFIAAFIAVPVLLVGGLAVYWTWIEYSFNRNTPLAANLQGSWGEIRDTFRQRVRERFPFGTPVADIVAGLTAQGFIHASELPSLGLTKPDTETAKLRARSDLPKMAVHGPGPTCTEIWTVSWELDASQRVTRTYGELSGYCL